MSHIQSLENGQILVISFIELDKIVPLFCGVCKFPMKTLEDSISFRAFGCCNHCEMYWTRTKFGKWEDGWRPDDSIEGWTDYLIYRKALSRRLITLK